MDMAKQVFRRKHSQWKEKKASTALAAIDVPQVKVSCTFGNEALGRIGQASSQKPAVLLKRKHMQCSNTILHLTRELTFPPGMWRHHHWRFSSCSWTGSWESCLSSLCHGRLDHRIFWGPFQPYLSYDSITKIAPSLFVKQYFSTVT